ncbi:MAG: EF-P beta-lysylation protein EpmB [Gammaproteobacteria bacterium]|nr:EF-P beta-lysylation protein EpmB [Gammaproteobacteria bacterium]
MIPVKSTSTTEVGPAPSHVPRERQSWQRELLEAVTDVDELLRLVGVDPVASRKQEEPVALRDFPLRVPRPYVARMRWGDPDDPLLRQVLPTAQESQPAEGYGFDPLAEADAVIDSGILKKYDGRALVIATGSCAVHCRYCFRRHFPYVDHRQDQGYGSLAALRRDSTIREVILSGGDPLMLTDAHLGRLLAEVGSIDHVTRIRIHTRVPVVIPQRVTPALTAMLASLPQRVVVVLHFNHPNEIDRHCAAALTGLHRFTLLNQSVLLRGVNDDADTLVELSERLFGAGVLPYYLHMPDAVAGTAHFDVCQRRAVALHRQLLARLPGYLVPRLVREVPGGTAKELVVSDG